MGVSSDAWKYGREYNGLFKAIKSFKQNVSKTSTAQDTHLKKSFLVYFVIYACFDSPLLQALEVLVYCFCVRGR